MPASNQTPEQWVNELIATCFDDAYVENMAVDVANRRADLIATRARADLADKLAEGLTLLVEQHDEPCRYDHNDFCQSHYSNRPCNIETARAILAEYEQEKAR